MAYRRKYRQISWRNFNVMAIMTSHSRNRKSSILQSSNAESGLIAAPCPEIGDALLMRGLEYCYSERKQETL